ncbi:MAG TPA: hypothetical protein HPP80_02120 [Rhodospirillaceae bacterium]|nr:hypothetical protein [Rhodospirillaceae bacterium]
MRIFPAIRSAFARNTEKIRKINQRYAHPRLAMSPAVRLSLLALRLYLLLLVGLLGYKFLITVMP